MVRRRRVNTINGRTYSEDPTIMAWNLINEPRAYRMAPQLQVMAPPLEMLSLSVHAHLLCLQSCAVLTVVACASAVPFQASHQITC
jgi:hypothetical protein